MKNHLQHKRIIKTIKWILIPFASFFLIFVLFAIIISFTYNERVKAIVENELNKHLQTEITIGATDLSLFRRFPHASFSFTDIYAKDATSNEFKDTLMTAKNVALNFNIIDIFKSKYKIRGIDLIDAKINLRIYEDGSNNYTFWKTDNDTHSEAFELILENIYCRNVHIAYNDIKALQDYDLHISKGHFSGRFYDDDYTLKAQAKTTINHIRIEDMVFLSNKKAEISFLLDVNAANEFYKFKEGALSVGEMKFNISGDIKNEDESVYLDLNIKSNRLKLKELVEELPSQLKEKLDNYDMKGNVELNTIIKGHTHSKLNPNIYLDFDMVSGQITQKNTGLSLQDVALKGQFSNGHAMSMKSSSLNLVSFSANLKQGHISGSLNIDNFISPSIIMSAKADACIDELLKLFDIDIFSQASGRVLFDVNFKAHLKNFDGFTTADFLKSQCHGKAKLTQCVFQLKNNKTIDNVNAELQFSNNDIVIDFLDAKYGASDFNFKGYFRNALAYMFLPEERITIDATLNTRFLSLDELLSSEDKSGTGNYQLVFPENLDFRLTLNVNKLKFSKFEAEKLNGKVSLNNRVFKADKIKFNAFDGSLVLDGNVDGRISDKMPIALNADIRKCNINKLFKQLNNFGQAELVDNNINGLLTCNLKFLANSNSTLDFDLSSIYADADITIEKGELIKYAPLEAMSRFIRVEDLSHIHFETLTNRILIKNKTIDIPHMKIRSDAINIDAMGTHTFDNKIDYRLQLYLTDILGRRARSAKKENEEFGYIVDDGLGQFTIFLKITGTVDNPIVSYDTKGAYEKTKTEIKQDVKETFQKIKEEFFHRNDSVVGLETERERRRRERRKQNEILEEFRLE